MSTILGTDWLVVGRTGLLDDNRAVMDDLVTFLNDGNINHPNLVDNLDGTYTWTSADTLNTVVIDTTSDVFVNGATLTGGVLTITDNDAGTPDITVDMTPLVDILVNNADGTYTFTNLNGAEIIDTRAIALPYNNTLPNGPFVPSLAATDVQTAITEINEEVDANDLRITALETDSHVPTTIGSLSGKIVVTASGVDNQTFNIDPDLEAADISVDPVFTTGPASGFGNTRAALNAINNLVDGMDNHIRATAISSDGSAIITATGTDNQSFDIKVDPFNTAILIAADAPSQAVISAAIVDDILGDIANDAISPDQVDFSTISLTDANAIIGNANAADIVNAIINDPTANLQFKANLETTTSLSYNAGSTELTYTDEDGNATVVNLSALTTDVFVNGGALVGTVLTLSDNDAGTADIVIDLADFLSSFTDNGDGTVTHDDGQGNTFTFDLNSSALPYDNTGSSLTATNVETALDQVDAKVVALTGTTHVAATVASADTTVDVTSSGTDAQTFDVRVNPQNTATSLAGNAAARTTLSNALADEIAGDFSNDIVPTSAINFGAITATEALEVSSAFATNSVDVDAVDFSNVDSVQADLLVAQITDDEIPTSKIDYGNIAVSEANQIVTGSDASTLVSHILGDPAAVTNFKTNLETTTALSYNSGTTEISYTDEDGGVTVINLSALTSDIFVNGASITGTVLTLSDNDGGTGDITVDFADFLSQFTNNGDGTYTHDDGQGNTTIIDTRASASPYTNGGTNIVATNVQDALTELDLEIATLDASSHVAASVASADGSVAIVASGTDAQTFNVTVDPENVVYNNGVSGLVSTNIKDAIDEVEGRIDTLEGSDHVASTVASADGSVSVVASGTDNQTFDVTVDPANVVFNNGASGLAATNVKDAIDEVDGRIDALEGSEHVAATINSADNSVAITPSGTDNQTFDVIVDPANVAYNNGVSGLTANNIKDAIDEVDGRIDTVELTSHVAASIASVDSTITVTPSGTDNQTFDVRLDPVNSANEIVASGPAVTTLANALADEVMGAASNDTLDPTVIDWTLITQPEADVIVGAADANEFVNAIVGDPTAIANFKNNIETLTDLSYDVGTTTLTYTDEDGNATVVNLSGLTSDIFVNGATLVGTTLTLTDNDGGTADIVVDFSTFLSVFADNGDGTYTHDDGQGNTFNIDLNANNLPYDASGSSLTSTTVQDALDELDTTVSGLGVNTHVPATVTSVDGSATITTSGTDNQTFDISVNESEIFISADFTSTPPASAKLWFVIANSTAYFYDGTSWVASA